MTNNPGPTDLYNWIGNSGGLWGSTFDWQDLTSGQNPASAVPGAGDPVTINGPMDLIYEVISGGGTAASVAVTGLIELLGTYSAGSFEIGSAVKASSSLILGSGAVVQAGTVDVANYGTLALNGAMLSASGAVITGTMSLSGGATLEAAGGVTVAYGSIIAQGTSTDLAISGNLVLGTFSPLTSPPPYSPYSNGEQGSLAISGGATVAVSGAITDADYSDDSAISVSGQGSSLTGGTLTLNAAEQNYTAVVSAGGALRVAGLSLINSYYGTYYSPAIYVDSTSIVEIGSAGTASAGAITIDPGITVAAAMNFSLLGNVVDNGTISEIGASLTISGTLSGSGVVQIGTGGTLSVGGLSGAAQVQLGASASMTLNGAASLGESIAFNGADAGFTIGAAFTGSYATGTYTRSYTPYVVNATLLGFATGDDIIINNTTLTNAVYTYAGNNTGSLALYAGTTAVETLTLAGNYTGRTFLVAPTTGSGTAIILDADATSGSSPVSNTTDLYNWIGNLGGAWGSASDWQDLTSGQNPASAVPGAGDSVTINGSNGSIYEVISGGGTAASVAVTGLIDLLGTYITGGFEIGSVQTSASAVTPTSGNLILGSGAVVQAGTVGVADGTLALSGAMLSTSGAVIIGTPGGYPTSSNNVYSNGASSTLNLSGGATLKAASGVTVAYGSLVAQGTSTDLAISGDLVLGTASSTTSTPPYYGVSGSLAISGGATVAVSGAITEADYDPSFYTEFSVSGQGSSLTGGTLTLNPTNEFLGNDTASVTAGGAVHVAGLSLINSYGFNAALSTSIYVDSTSIVEIGTAGTASAGAITIDPGITVAAATYFILIGNVVNNGTISGSSVITGTLSGSGVVQIGASDNVSVGGLSGAAQVQLGASASLTLNGAASSGASIAFNGAGASLTIDAAGNTYVYTPYVVKATLSGFATGDSLIANHVVYDNVVYTYAGNNTGTLILYTGTLAVETLTLAGNYSTRKFSVSSTTNGGSAVTLLAQPVVGTVPGNEVVPAGTVTALPGFTITDPNALASSITVTLADTLGDLSATNSAGGTVTGAGSTNLTVSGSVSQVNADLATLTYLTRSGGSDTIIVNAIDSLGSSAVQATRSVTVVPQLTSTVLLTHVSEGATLDPSTSILSFTDSSSTDTASAFTATIDWGDGTTSKGSVTGAAGLFTVTPMAPGHIYQVEGERPLSVTVSGPFGSTLISQGTLDVADVLTAGAVLAVSPLQSVDFTGAVANFTDSFTGNNASDFTATIDWGDGSASSAGTVTYTNGAISVSGDHAYAAQAGTKESIKVTLSDASGASATVTTAATVATENGLPVITPAAALTLGVGQSGGIAGISLSETGNTIGELFTLTLSDSAGLLSVSTAPGVSGSGSTSLTLTGTLGQVTADLATLTDTDSATGSDTITLNAHDSFGNAATSQTVAVTVNGLPAITPAGAQTLEVGTAARIAGISLNEAGNLAGEIFTVTLADTIGLLSAGGAGVTGSGTTSLTLTGTLAQVNAALATMTDTDNVVGTDTIVLNASDNFGNVASAAQLGVTVNGLTIAAGPVTIGSGSDTLTLSVSEDAWQGDAQFTIDVDGQQIGGILTASASHAAGQAQLFNVLGDFGSAAHTVTVTFLNDLYDGPGFDRNLYVAGATLDGTAIANSALALMAAGPETFSFGGPPPSPPAPVTIGSGSDTLTLSMSEDAWQGDAQFTIEVDGQQIGGILTISASHVAGQVQLFNVLGDFGSSAHTLTVTFLNDRYDGPGFDRNLYVAGATLDGTAIANSALALMAAGPETFSFGGPPPSPPAPVTIGSGSDTLTLSMSEDAWQGDAQFTIEVDGQQIGGSLTASASHAAGQAQLFNVLGDFGSAAHTVTVTFLNDLYDGPGFDRNLYVAGATLDGTAIASSALALMAPGPETFSFGGPPPSPPAPVTIGSGSETLTLSVSEDAWQGDAQFTIEVDGQQIGGTLTTSASHAAGQVQLFNVLGDFGSSAHTVTVTFLNDRYDGPGFDRNLYVAGATLNGTTIVNSALALMAHGPQTFGFDGSAPVVNTASSQTITASSQTTTGQVFTLTSGVDSVAGGVGDSITNLSNVLLASAPGNLSFIANTINGVTINDASNGVDTLEAGGLNQTLTGGSGYDMLFGYSGGSTTFLGTTVTMTGDTIENFAASNDIIDLTDVQFAANPSVTFVENTAQTGGVLSVSDASNSVTLTLAGVFDPTKFHTGPDSGAGTIITYH